MKKVPFYRSCTVTKFRGGKLPLWHACLALIGTVDDRHAQLVGAGKTADLAIADLKKQIAASDVKDKLRDDKERRDKEIENTLLDDMDYLAERDSSFIDAQETYEERYGTYDER